MNWLIGKDPDAGKDWGQEEKGTTEDEMVGWHHQLDGHEFEQAPGIGEGQGSLACCGPWARLSDWTELNWIYIYISAFNIGIPITTRESEGNMRPVHHVLESEGVSHSH